MRKNTPLLIFCCLLSPAVSYAQRPAEKIYIQTDRDYYAKGETIHFKGYVISDADTIESSNLFVELWDSSFQKLAYVSVPVIDATSSGSLIIPNNTSSEQLFLRAYTDISAYQDLQFIKPLLGEATNDLVQEAPGRPVFYPEGGKLVYNALNYVAYKAPLDFSGTIRKSKGELISSIKPDYNGMGVFRFRPIRGETYFCHWTENGTNHITALPVPVESGIALHVKQTDDTLYFDLDNGGNRDPNILKLKVQLLIGKELVYLVDIIMHNDPKFSYFIPLSTFKAGMGTVRVLDKQDNILASRPVFIAGRSFDPDINIEIIKKDLDKRGGNQFKINLRDTTFKYVSVSVTDAAYNVSKPGSGVFAALLVPGIPSIPERKDKENYPGKLDIILLTMDNYQVPETKKYDSQGVIATKYLQLNGIVKKGKKLLENKEVLVMIRSEHTGKEFYKVVTDSLGRFTFDGLILYGDAYVYCKLPGNSDDELSCEFRLDLPVINNDISFFNAFKQKARAMMKRYNRPAIAAAPAQGQSLLNDTLVFGEKVIVLEEAVVTADSRQLAQKRLEEVERKYLHGTGFGGYGTQAETLDVMNDPQASKLIDLFSYIASKMHMVRQLYVRGRKELIYPIRGIHGDTIIQAYYLDGNRIDRHLVDGIPLNQIAVIKFIPMLGSEYNLPPAIGIFLRKPGDLAIWEKEKAQVIEKKISGYPVLKDLPMPDYSKSDMKVQSDTRKSLLWQPYTVVKNGVGEIRFYNNDVTKKIRIVVEGINENGNIVFFEKELE